MKTKKYLVYAGYVRSIYDGDLRFITTNDLIRLYDVDPAECIRVPHENVLTLRGIKNLDDYIALHPKINGDYTIPEKN